MPRLLLTTIALLGLMAACATSPEEHKFDEHPSHGAPDLLDKGSGSPEAPEIAPQTILGKAKSAIEADLKPVKTLTDGWVAYSDTLLVRYEADVATELKTRTPNDLGCKDTVAWLGYQNARVPIMRKEGCLWPFDSPKHGLGKDISAILDFDSRTITIKVHP